jgi:hypothetical protein
MNEAPGPHGPVPMRIYTPDRAGDALGLLAAPVHGPVHADGRQSSCQCLRQ